MNINYEKCKKIISLLDSYFQNEENIAEVEYPSRRFARHERIAFGRRIRRLHRRILADHPPRALVHRPVRQHQSGYRLSLIHILPNSLWCAITHSWAIVADSCSTSPRLPVRLTLPLPGVSTDSVSYTHLEAESMSRNSPGSRTPAPPCYPTRPSPYPNPDGTYPPTRY